LDGLHEFLDQNRKRGGKKAYRMPTMSPPQAHAIPVERGHCSDANTTLDDGI